MFRAFPSSSNRNDDDSDSEEVHQPLSIEDLYALAIEMKHEGKLKMAKQSCLEGIQKLQAITITTTAMIQPSSSPSPPSPSSSLSNHSSSSLLFSFYNLISQICLELKEYEDALDYCQHVLDLDSLFMEARYRMGFILIQMKVFDLAKNLIEESIMKLEHDDQVFMKFSNLLEIIEKNVKKNHHDHSHDHSQSLQQHNKKLLAIHLIRTFSQNFIPSLISEFLMMTTNNTINMTNNTTTYSTIPTTTQLIITTKKDPIMFLLLPKSMQSHVPLTSPYILFYEDDNVMMPCKNIYNEIIKSSSLEHNEQAHCIIIASPSSSLKSIEEFRNDFNLVHSCVSVNAHTFYNDLKSDENIIQVIEESNVVILENRTERMIWMDDDDQTTLDDDIKTTLQALNTTVTILDSKQSNTTTNNILHHLLHSSNTKFHHHVVDHLGWWKTLSNQQHDDSSQQQQHADSKIVSFVYSTRKPFSLPQVLQKLNNSNGEETQLFWDIVIRSKGLMWIDSDHNYLYDWSTTGGSKLKVSKKTLFLAAYPSETLSKVNPERLVEMKKINKWMEPFGDRRQEIAFICRKTLKVPDPCQFITQFLSSMTKRPSCEYLYSEY